VVSHGIAWFINAGNIINELLFYMLLAVLAINVVLVFFTKNKTAYLIHIGLEIMEFVILTVILALLASVIIWYKRDIPLMEITHIEYFSPLYVFISLVFITMIVSYAVILAVNMAKSLKINKTICILLFPVKYFILGMLFLFTGGSESLCVWDPLVDTNHSAAFNVYNIDKIEEGMTKEYVTALIGEPLDTYTDKEGVMYLKYTQDGKCSYGDYAWFEFQLEFRDNRVVTKRNQWMYD
jgi:hypothetical protein